MLGVFYIHKIMGMTRKEIIDYLKKKSAEAPGTISSSNEDIQDELINQESFVEHKRDSKNIINSDEV